MQGEPGQAVGRPGRGEPAGDAGQSMSPPARSLSGSRAALVLGFATSAAVLPWLLSEWELNQTWGFPLDDSWIHMQIARNLGSGNGMYFNAGEPVSASSAPLWTVLLAGLHLLPADVVVAAKLAGVLLLWGTGTFTFLLARQAGLSGGWALLAGVAAATTPRLIWGSLSGMEITLYAAAATAGIWLCLRRRGRPPGPGATVLLAASALARPECLLLFPVLLLDSWLRMPSRPRTRVFGDLAPPCLLFALLLAPFVAFNFATIGHPFPNTYYAKVGPYGLPGALARLDVLQVLKCLSYYPLLQLVEAIEYGATNNAVLTAGALAGAIAARHRPAGPERLLLVLILALPLVRGVVAPYKGATFQHGRYVAHLVPLIAVLGTVGLRDSLLWLARSRRVAFLRESRILRPASCAWVAVALNALLLQPGAARQFGENVRDIQKMHLPMARWIARETPEDAVVATHDIGALGYFSGRRIIDTAGLVTPEVLAYLKPRQAADEGVLEFLTAKRPEFVVVMPNWYPRLVESSCLLPVHSVSIESRSISAGDLLVAYRTEWP